MKITDLVLQAEDDVRKYYTFDKVLGKGNFGVVHQVRHKVFSTHLRWCLSSNML